MAKSVSSTVLDQALNYIKNNGTRQDACSAQPTTYTEATSTFTLANVTLTGTDWTLAAGDTSGRKVTVASKSGTVSANGTATHVAISDTSGTALLLVTTCTSQALTSGNPITFPAWKWEVNSPT